MMSPESASLLEAVAAVRLMLDSGKNDESTKVKVGQCLMVIFDASQSIPGGGAYIRETLSSLRYCVRTIFSGRKLYDSEAKQRATESLDKIQNRVRGPDVENEL